MVTKITIKFRSQQQLQQQHGHHRRRHRNATTIITTMIIIAKGRKRNVRKNKHGDRAVYKINALIAPYIK